MYAKGRRKELKKEIQGRETSELTEVFLSTSIVRDASLFSLVFAICPIRLSMRCFPVKLVDRALVPVSVKPIIANLLEENGLSPRSARIASTSALDSLGE